MNSSDRSGRRAAIDTCAVLARCVLGIVFLYLGLNKALHVVDFLKLLRQYDILHNPLLLNSVAAALPWFEVFCGILLLAGIAVRGTALTLLILLVPFTGLVLHRALVLKSALAIPFCAVKFDCGCGNGAEFICRKLLENFLLVLIAGWLLFGYGRKWSLRFDLIHARPEPPG